MNDGTRKRRWLTSFYLFAILAGTILLPQVVFGALTANVTNDSTVQLNWSNTGTSPYVLTRNGTQIFSGSGTSFTDTNLGYSAGYNYVLSYQNYEKTGGGYYTPDSYWGVVTPAHYEPKTVWGIKVPAHEETTYELVPWCEATINGEFFSHAPPCQYSSSSTTKLQEKKIMVPDEYGWITVSQYVPDQYGWIGYDRWVPEVYDYVTRTTSVKSGPLLGTIPSISIVSPTNNQWLSSSLVPRISVSDQDGETLTTSYKIDNESTARETKVISNTATAQQVAFTGLNLSSLSEGAHQIKFSVTDNHHADVLASATFNIDRTGPVIGNAQISATATQLTVTGAATDAGSGLSVTPYRFKIGANQSAWISAPYVFGSLNPDTAYQLTVEAKDKVDNVSSKQQTVYTIAQVPTVSVLQSLENSLAIRVNDSNPATTRYQIKVGTSYLDATGKLSPSPVTLSLTNKQLTAIGLQPGTNYAIQATAVNQAGALSNWSNSMTGMTTSVAPTNVNKARTQTSITLTWATVIGAASYDLEVDGVIVNNGAATSYMHSGLYADTNHIYRIRSNNAGGIGNWSSSIQFSTLPNPPGLPTGLESSYEQTYVTLNWNASPRAETYEVEADGVILNAGSSTTYTHAGLRADSRHAYRIRAVNIGGKSDWSEPLSVTTWPDPPPTPESVTAEPSIYSVSVAWEAALRATGYEIEVDGYIVDNRDRLRFLHEGLRPLTGHTYRVRGVNIGGKSPWSDPIDITTHPEAPVTPTNLMATSEEDSITVTWYNVPNAATYDIEIDGTVVNGLRENVYEDTDLSGSTSHTYRVRANNISGTSEWSAPIRMSSLPPEQSSPAALTNVAAIVTNRFITLSWDTVAPDAQYDIEVDGVLMDNGSETIFNHTGLRANEFHTYKVRVKTHDAAGDWVAVLSLSTLSDLPDAPSGIEAYPSIHSIELNWNSVQGATGYDIEIDGEVISVGADSTYLHEQLDAGTAHSYRIRAKNESGLTAWSPSIVKSTNSPSYRINAIQGEVFALTLYAYNVQDFSEMEHVVTFDPSQLEIVDLYQYTPKKDVGAGLIPNSPLSATLASGKITYVSNKNVVPGTSWSGEITTILFMPKVTGQVTIDAIVE